MPPYAIPAPRSNHLAVWKEDKQWYLNKPTTTQKHRNAKWTLTLIRGETWTGVAIFKLMNFLVQDNPENNLTFLLKFKKL